MAAQDGRRWLVGVLAGLVATIGLVLWQVRPTYDLAYFLPAPATEQEAVLVERLGQGAGARLVFIEIDARAGDDALAQSAGLRERLARSPLFLRVENGQPDVSIDSIPASVWRSRYLLADADWSSAGLTSSLADRVTDLTTLGGPEIARLIATDPLWLAPRILEGLKFGRDASGPRWTDGERRAYLVAETVAAPFDIAAQQQAIEEVRGTYREVSGGRGAVQLFGVGVYGALMQDLIQRDSQLLGLVATLAVLIIVSLAYRSVRLTMLSVIPLASAVLGGLIASTAIFGSIHGITIAFGATLVGVVDDYPMHLFSHARHMAPRDGVRLLFRTLLASAGTAIVAYAALAFSGSRGLAQLGVFSLTGIACAMAVTCWVLPHLMKPAPPVPHDTVLQEFRLSSRVWLPVLAVAVIALGVAGGIRWNDNLGDVTPLPRALLQQDNAMRQRFGAPDVRYLVSITADSEEAALALTEELGRRLGGARQAGLLGAWSAVTELLPPAATQRRRLAAIPPPDTLRARLADAGRGLPFRADAFEPFLAAVEEARQLQPVRAADVVDGFAADFVSSHLTKSGGQWRSVVFLAGITAPDRLAEWLRVEAPAARLVDLKAASESLVRSYRIRLMTVLAIAGALIAILIAWSTGSAGRFLWSVATVVASVLLTLAAVNLVNGSVSVFHLVALVLVAGLGVDYCLFYSRPGVTRTEFLDTRHALVACATSTAGAFAILGTSSIPLLASVGSTVGLGTALMFLAARFGCRAMDSPGTRAG